MSEEKKGSCCCSGGGGVKVLSKMLLGLIFIVLGVLLGVRWQYSLFTLIKGCLGPFLVLLGLVFLAIAKE